MLTDKEIKGLKPKDKTYKKFDGNGSGLYVEVLPSGVKSFRVKVSIHGYEKRPTLGIYPDLSLKEARAMIEQAKAKAIEEAEANEAAPQVEIHTFSAVALEWIEKQAKVWSPDHKGTVEYRVRRFAFPHIGDRDIASITAPDALAFLRLIEGDSKYETASRVRGICSQVFRYGIACGYCTNDPCRDLAAALTPHETKPNAALTKPEDIARLMAGITNYHGQRVTVCALFWSAYTACRPGEVRKAEWSEIDMEKELWTIPAAKTKMRRDHVVPLPKQCMEILR